MTPTTSSPRRATPMLTACLGPASGTPVFVTRQTHPDACWSRCQTHPGTCWSRVRVRLRLTRVCPAPTRVCPALVRMCWLRLREGSRHPDAYRLCWSRCQTHPEA